MLKYISVFVKQGKQKQQNKIAQTFHKMSIFTQHALVIPNIKANIKAKNKTSLNSVVPLVEISQKSWTI